MPHIIGVGASKTVGVFFKASAGAGTVVLGAVGPTIFLVATLFAVKVLTFLLAGSA